MSRFFSEKYSRLVPYTPGEQPKEKKFIKLNTNESPFPPSPRALFYAAEASRKLNLYSDPECRKLTDCLLDYYCLGDGELLLTNGSDEILNFAFMAFCDKDHPAAFADITYGFYKVFAELHGIPYEAIPLRDDFTIDPEDYIGINKTIFIANPNAPTGIALPLSDIERIVASNPNNVVVIDEAYVDFGGDSALPLTKKYDNLLVTRTFSKSRSMAGARLGFGAGNSALIGDMNTIKYSTNPYNVNSMTLAAGLGTMEDDDYTLANCKTIIENREYTVAELKKLGFKLTDSKANFVFAEHREIDGATLYAELRARGILVRYFNAPRISNRLRITIGSKEQMEALVSALCDIVKED